MSQKLEEERELFSRLTIQQMEEIAAESQALVDKLLVMAKANGVTPAATTAICAPVDGGESKNKPRDVHGYRCR